MRWIAPIAADSDQDGDVDLDDLRAFDSCANECIRANVNWDGAGVNVIDLQFVKNNMFCTDETSAGCIISDVNRDGSVNVIDLQFVKNNMFCADAAVNVTPGCEWADLDLDGDVIAAFGQPFCLRNDPLRVFVAQKNIGDFCHFRNSKACFGSLSP